MLLLRSLLKLSTALRCSLRDALRAVSGSPAFLQLDDFSAFTAPLAELGDALPLEAADLDEMWFQVYLIVELYNIYNIVYMYIL